MHVSGIRRKGLEVEFGMEMVLNHRTGCKHLGSECGEMGCKGQALEPQHLDAGQRWDSLGGGSELGDCRDLGVERGGEAFQGGRKGGAESDSTGESR